jgi:Annexin
MYTAAYCTCCCCCSVNTGIGTNEQVLIECLAPRSNARIQAMKLKYDARNSRPLIDRLNSELSGYMKKLIIQLLKAERNENAPADNALAAQQARQLHDAGVGQWGTNESVFIDILTKSSRSHIEAIKAEYERQYGHSFHRAIEKETSGDLEDALLALVRTPTEYYARRLKKAFAGLGVSLFDTYIMFASCSTSLRHLQVRSAVITL